MLVETQTRPGHHRVDVALAILVALLALAVRIDSIGFNSLSEDETAKWQAVQQYRQGHFAGVNSEHPMMLKLLAWGSIAAGERWNRFASQHRWPTISPEASLRIPNVLFGAATAAILYFLCRLAMGIAGSFAAGFFWAVSPLTIGLNRLAKEETALCFFTVLACYCYRRAKKGETDTSTRRWFDFSACAFGLATASQYVFHLFGLNALAWHLAGRRGLDQKPLGSRSVRFLIVMGLVFFLANPFVLSPASISYALHWLHHDGIRHTGYDFSGSLYRNFPSLLLAGVPWYFYVWMLLVKTPIPILVAILVGSMLLLRDRRSIGSCFFLTMGLLQFACLSISGAKWMRYSLWFLPFLYLAAGYGVHVGWNYARQKRIPVASGLAALVVLAWPLLNLIAWKPYYPMYLNAIGGGMKNVTRYFAPDEVSEFDTREVAQQICPSAPRGMTVATGRPASMTYYLMRCGRSDLNVVALYDPLYMPGEGDRIVLEGYRRFFETQRYFDLLTPSAMPRNQVQTGLVSASTILVFQPSAVVAGSKSESTAHSSATSTSSQRKHSSAHASGAIAELLEGEVSRGSDGACFRKGWVCYG